MRTSRRFRVNFRTQGFLKIQWQASFFGDLPFSLARWRFVDDTPRNEMVNPDDFQYAMETTRVLHEPDRRIDTFGSTSFDFEILSEPMDSVGKVRIRRGEVEAQKPTLIKPDGFNDIELEGFDPEVLRVIAHFKEQGIDLSFLQYGFQFRRTEVSEELVHERLENVREKAVEHARKIGNPSLAIIESVDDTWEVGVMKFTLEMIMKSREINQFDFKRRGLL